MNSKLNLIVNKAKQDSKLRFGALVHHINEENLLQCYQELAGNKACGIDRVTKEEYGKDLKGNISLLIQKMKAKKYQPQPTRRVYIPKPGKEEKRGLGISAFEDKLVQLMIKKILEAIFEVDFLSCSYGFRPGLSCHDAISRLDEVIIKRNVNYVVEVDIKKFFDNISHFWMERCLKQRISDPNMLWLIRRFLKAGIMEAGKYQATDQGSQQGNIASPILANIYMHYVIDLWFEKTIKPKCKGYAELIRYCDDYVVCFAIKSEAKKFHGNNES